MILGILTQKEARNNYYPENALKTDFLSLELAPVAPSPLWFVDIMILIN